LFVPQKTKKDAKTPKLDKPQGRKPKREKVKLINGFQGKKKIERKS